VPWPLILVEGEELSRKTQIALTLSASEFVGRTFVLELDGSGSADQYAELGPYEVLEVPDGATWQDYLDALRAAAAAPPVLGRPNVIIVDTCSVVWERQRLWASNQARRSLAAVQLLEVDENAVIDIPHELWDRARARWNELITIMRTFPGIGIVIADGHDQADGGYKVDAEWSIGYAAHAWVRCRRGKSPTLIGAQVIDRHDAIGWPIDQVNPLEFVAFGVLGAMSAGPDNPDGPNMGVPGPGPDGPAGEVDAAESASPAGTDESEAA
jgi:hypothetical protein